MSESLLQPQPLAQDVKEFYELFVSDSRIKRYLFGHNVYTEAMVKNYPIDGIIDEWSRESAVMGVPVLSLKEIDPENALVLVLSGGNILTAMDRVRGRGLRSVHYAEFQRLAPKALPPLRFNENFREHYDLNEKRFMALYRLLEDLESKRLFEKLVNFRYFQDTRWLRGLTENQKNQYIEPFLPWERIDSFLDVGAYDGETTKSFIRQVPDYRRIELFEPDPRNFAEAVNSLKGYGDIRFHQVACSDQKTVLRFRCDRSASTLCEEGDMSVETDRIDDLVDEKFSYLKMDIEGAESSALEGAKSYIAAHMPVLAVSIYHSPEQMWSIAHEISTVHDGYKFYLRHYTESIYETILYCLPEAE